MENGERREKISTELEEGRGGSAGLRSSMQSTRRSPACREGKINPSLETKGGAPATKRGRSGDRRSQLKVAEGDGYRADGGADGG